MDTPGTQTVPTEPIPTQPATQTTTVTQTRTSTGTKTAAIVGVVLLAGAGIAAAAAMLMATRAVLVLDVANTPLSSTVVKGTTDVPFFGVTLTAKNKNITVKALTVTAFGDNDGTFTTTQKDVNVQNHLSSCSLFNNASGALLSGPKPVDTAGKIAFNNFSAAVTTTSPSSLLVKCTLSNTDVDGGNPDIYALSIKADADVTAEVTANGNVIPGDRIHIGAPADPGLNVAGRKVAITVLDRGTLFVDLDSATPASDIVLAASSNVQVGKWAIRSGYEGFVIDTLTFRNTGNDANFAAVKVTGPNGSGSTITKTGVLSGGVVKFDSLGFVIPESDPQGIYLLVDTNAVSETGATSGNNFTFVLDETSTGAFEAVGSKSGETVTEATADWAGIDSSAMGMVIRKSRPTISLASGSPSGTAAPGRAEVLKFNVTADTRGDVGLHHLFFRISSTDNASTGWNFCGDGSAQKLGDKAKWTLYSTDDMSQPVASASDWIIFTGTNTSDCGTDPQPVTFAGVNLSNQTIGAGATKTYSLYIDTTGASSEDDSIRVDLLEDNLFWIDSDPAVLVPGTYVKNLPVTGGTLTY